jgi:hypothetical protein
MSFKPINKDDEELNEELEGILDDDNENGDEGNERPENPMGETLRLRKRKMKSSNVSSCKPSECRNFSPPPPPPPPAIAIAAGAGGKRKKSKNNRKYKNKNRKRRQTKRINKRNKKYDKK